MQSKSVKPGRMVLVTAGTSGIGRAIPPAGGLFATYGLGSEEAAGAAFAG